MNDFTLDERLANDCIILGRLDVSVLLLLNNALVPWFVLVPETKATELHEVEPDIQRVLLTEINQLSGFVQERFATDKLNIAAIGNKVRQLHVHVVGRKVDDFCWPEVVWGAGERVAYANDKVTAVVSDLRQRYPGRFTPNPSWT